MRPERYNIPKPEKLIPVNFQRAYAEACRKKGTSDELISRTKSALSHDDVFESSSAGFSVTFPGTFDFRVYPEITQKKDLPHSLQVEGHLIIPQEKIAFLENLTARTIHVKGFVQIILTKEGTLEERKRIKKLFTLHPSFSSKGVLFYLDSPQGIQKIDDPEETQENEDFELTQPIFFDEAITASPVVQLSHEDYAEYLIENGIGEKTALGETVNVQNLRLVPHLESVYKLLTQRPEFRTINRQRFDLLSPYGDRFNSVDHTKSMCHVFDEFLKKPISGVKAVPDALAKSDGFHNFKINNDQHATKNQSKVYITLSNPYGEFSAEILSGLLGFLRSNGYNGQFKIHNDSKEFRERFDNIVMHGSTEEDSQRGLQLCMQYFKTNHVGVSQYRLGEDMGNVSHMYGLAQHVVEEIKKRNQKEVDAGIPSRKRPELESYNLSDPELKKEVESEIELSNQVWQHLKKAIDLQTSDIDTGKEPRPLREYIAQIWPNGGVIYKPTVIVNIPKEWFPLVDGKLEFGVGSRPDSCDGHHARRKLAFTIAIQIGSLDSARGEDRKKYIDQIQRGLFHEAQHIFNDDVQGGQSQTDFEQDLNHIKDKDTRPNISKKLLVEGEQRNPNFVRECALAMYLCSPGEIRSYACGLARTYAHYLPGKSFDKKELPAILAQMLHKGIIYEWYITHFADPSIQKNYDVFVNDFMGTNLQKAHTDFIKWVEYFLVLFNQKS